MGRSQLNRRRANIQRKTEREKADKPTEADEPLWSLGWRGVGTAASDDARIRDFENPLLNTVS